MADVNRSCQMRMKAFGQSHDSCSMINKVAATSLHRPNKIPSQSINKATAGFGRSGMYDGWTCRQMNVLNKSLP